MHALENEFVLEVFKILCEKRRNWVADSTTTMFPSFTEIIEQSVDGNFGVIQSVLCLNNYLADWESRPKSVTSHIDAETVIDIRKVWAGLSMVVLQVKAQLLERPSTNIFESGMLDPSQSYFLPFAIFFCQIGLSICLFLSVIGIEAQPFWPTWSSGMMSFISTFLVLLSLKNQWTEFFKFRRVFGTL